MSTNYITIPGFVSTFWEYEIELSPGFIDVKYIPLLLDCMRDARFEETLFDDPSEDVIISGFSRTMPEAIDILLLQREDDIASHSSAFYKFYHEIIGAYSTLTDLLSDRTGYIVGASRLDISELRAFIRKLVKHIAAYATIGMAIKNRLSNKM